MQRKKPKPPKRRAYNFRLTAEEDVAVQADIDELTRATGIPVTTTAYIKHAVREYPRLRKAGGK